MSKQTDKPLNREEKRLASYNFGYPKTVVLAINTHGFILVNEDGLYNTFKLKQIIKRYSKKGDKNFTFYKINAVAPGICNLLYDSQIQTNIELIERALHKLKEENRSENNKHLSMYDFSNQLRNILFGFQSFYQKDLKEEAKEFKKEGETVKMHQDYLQHFDKGFSLCDFTNTDIINKGYLRKNEEGMGDHLNWQITVVNMRQKPDILNNINLEKGIGIHHHGDSETNLAEILDHLYRHGVHNVLMIDFSCSNFVDENLGDILTDRGVRSARSTIIRNEESHCTSPTIKAPNKINV